MTGRRSWWRETIVWLAVIGGFGITAIALVVSLRSATEWSALQDHPAHDPSCLLSDLADLGEDAFGIGRPDASGHALPR